MKDKRDIEPPELKGKKIKNFCLNQDPINIGYDKTIYFDKFVKGMREYDGKPAAVILLHFSTDDSSKSGKIEVQVRYDKRGHQGHQYPHYNTDINFREIQSEPYVNYDGEKFNHTKPPPLSGVTIETYSGENYSEKLKVSGVE